MMIIKQNDFVIETSKNGNFFDLSFNVTTKKKDGTEEQELKVVAYGIPLDTCIKRVVDYNMRKLEGEYTFKEVVNLYKQNVKKLEDLIYDNT